MKTIKVIDLLNKIANGENISNNHMKYFNRQDQEYDICLICLPNLTYKLDNDIVELNDEVEILEEEKKDNFTGWKMYQDEKEVCSMDCSAEEEKKIPEKLEEIGEIFYNLEYIDYKNIEVLKIYLNEDFQTIYDTLDLLIKNQNQLIDYLKSKGE